MIFDEFPTIYFNGIDNLIATALSNKVATSIAVQDYSQLKNEYSREQAEVILNIMGNNTIIQRNYQQIKEGSFDFALVDSILAGARKQDLHLVLLQKGFL